MKQKKKRLRGKIKEYLSKGSRDTLEILDYINSNSRSGLTVYQVSNILARDPDIKKIGYCRRIRAMDNASYNIVLWGLKDE